MSMEVLEIEEKKFFGKYCKTVRRIRSILKLRSLNSYQIDLSITQYVHTVFVFVFSSVSHQIIRRSMVPIL